MLVSASINFGQQHNAPIDFEVTAEMLVRMRHDPVFFCHTFGHYPHWYQEQIMWCDARRVVINMSRQIGKTYAVALVALHFVFTRPKVNVLIVAPSERQSKIMFETIEDVVTSHQILQDSVKKIIQGEIKLKNGSTIYNFPIRYEDTQYTC